MMYTFKLFYKEAGECYELGEVYTNMSMTIDQLLYWADVDMDKFAADHHWDNWNPECIEAILV